MRNKLIRKTTLYGWFLAIAIILSATLLSMIVYGNYYSNKMNSSQWERDFEIVKLKGTIIHLNEVLSMSARMAAETGDEQWEKRYHLNDLKLDSAINKIKENAPTAMTIEFAQSTQIADMKLDDLENMAFNFVHANQLEKARHVLYSNEYEKQKGIYKAGMDKLSSEMDSFLKERQNAAKKNFYSELWLIGFIILILFVVWFFVFLIIHRTKHELRLKVEERTAELSRANRNLNFISQINQMIVHITDEQTLFNKACNTAIDTGKLKMAWIGITDEETKKVISVAHAGDEDGYLSEIRSISVEDIREGNGPTGTAMREGNYSIINDIENDPRMAPWKDEALKHDYRSCIALPIKKWGKTVGSFSLYSSETNFFDKEEISLLVEVTGDISFAMENLEKEKKLKGSEAQYRRLFEAARDGILILNADTGVIEDVNPFMEEMLGYARDEFLGKELWEIGLFKDIIANKDAFLKLKEEHYIRYDNLPLETKGGQAIWVEFVSNTYDVNGRQVIQCNIRETTDRKKAEEKLTLSETHLAEAQRLAKMGSWNYDIKTDKLNWSEEIYKVFDTDKQTFHETHSSFIHLIDIEDRENALQTSRHSQKTGDPFTIIYQITTPKGEKRLIQEYGYGEKDDKGNVIRLFGTAQDITERIIAEENLKQSENRFRVMIENSTDMKTLTTKEGKVLYGSPSIQKVMGYSIEEYLLKYPEDIIHPDDIEDYLERRDALTETPGESFYFEQRRLAKAGNWIWCEGTITNMLDEPGIHALVSNFKDISERKHSEQIILESEARLKEAQALSHSSNWEIDLLTGTNIWSDEFYKIFGIKFGDVKPSAEAFLSFIHPEDRKFAQQKVEVAFKTFETSSFNFRFLAKDGKIRYGYTEWRFEFDENKKPIRLFGILQDITETKLGEENLKQSESRFREFFESAPEALVVVDVATLHFIRYNDNALKLLKYSPEEILKVGPVEVSPEFQPDGRSSQEKAMEMVIGVMKGNKPVVDWLIKDVTGKEILCELRLVLLSTVGSPQILSSFVDITERKKAEEKLEQQNKELLKTNIELDRFVYSTSHDLRAPLKSLLGLADIINEDIEPGNSIQHERMQMMKQSVIKLDNFIEDILHYSRNTRMEVAKEEINFEEAIKEIRGNHKFMEGVTGLRLNVEINQGGKFISDSRRVDVILNNLISNAVKYQDASKVNSFLKIFIQSNKENAVIEIADNGIGIADHDKKKIFEMFYRATKNSTGSGLGLYIVKETIDKLGGTIHLESELNEGAKFTVTIPNQIATLN